MATRLSNSLEPIPQQAAATYIERLNDDILHEIFYVLALTPPRRGIYLPIQLSLNFKTSWLAITHTCSHWRRVAVTSPRLWSKIIVYVDCCEPTLRMFLSRSQDMGLTVLIHGSTARPDGVGLLVQMSRLLAQHTRRFISFGIVDVTRRYMRDILAAFTYPAPRLTEVMLVAYPHQPPPVQSNTVASSLFSNDTPTLRTMLAPNVWLPWRSYRNMVYLDLMVSSFQSADEVLQSIQHCKALRRLRIETRNNGGRPSALNAPFTTVHLPDLTYLYLRGLYSSIARIASCLAVPADASISVILLHQPNDRLDNHQRGRTLYPSTSRVTAAQCDVTFIHTAACLRFTSTDTQFVAIWAWQNFRGASDVDVDDVLNHFGDLLVFPALSRLTIRYNTLRLSALDWRSILSQMPSLEVLEIEGGHHTHVANLFQALGIVDALDGTSIVCPGLTCIHATSCKGWNVLANPLSDVVRLRSSIGMRLNMLKIVTEEVRELLTLEQLRDDVDELWIESK